MSSRSTLTIEDLKSKLGTYINGHKIKGEKHVITEDKIEIKLGSMGGFKIVWYPVVLSFSFTRRELDAGAQTKLQDNLEQLDIKFLADYDSHATTHVVSKKRNTSKGLQALVNGIHIVDDGFINTIIAGVTPEDTGDGVERSALEANFDKNWPNALNFLPAPGNEPVQRPTEAFAPNPARNEMFDGYTFIFYDQKQHESLIGPITDGRGKALYKEVIPHKTEIDEFVGYVKSIAGEKGLGEFEDGSVGKGVVVVRYVPRDDWYEEFYRAVSLRLDHRLIDQKDFLDAILNCDASGLRRHLEVETPAATQNAPNTAVQAMEADGGQTEPSAQGQVQASAPTSGTQARGSYRPARPTRKRFRGFVADSDSDEDGNGDAAMMNGPLAADPSQPPVIAIAESSQEGLFVSQEPDTTIQEPQRKRPLAQSFEDDFAPTAAQLKRRRIAAGEDPIPRQPVPEPEPEEEAAGTKGKRGAKNKSPKIKKEVNVLEAARKQREEVEAQARAEQDQLEADAAGIDLAEIRRLQIQEPMKLRTDVAPARTREQDIEDGRWDPAWNGRKNFKKFRQRGAVEAARTAPRIIVALQEVKQTTGGIGDDYWLEDETTQRRKKKSQRDAQSQTNGLRDSQKSTRRSQDNATVSSRRSLDEEGQAEIDKDTTMEDSRVDSDLARNDEDESEDAELVYSATRKRGARAALTQQASLSRLQHSTTQKAPSKSTAKRVAVAPPSEEQPAKRSKTNALPSDDEDDSEEDELRFKFKRR